MSSDRRITVGLMAQLMWRETRGSRGRFLFFVTCLAVGVAAIVCVAGLTANLDRRIRDDARQLMAADLMVSGLQPISPAVEEFLDQRQDLSVTYVRELITVALGPEKDRAPGKSQVIELKVIQGQYPFYGYLETDPTAPLSNLLEDRGLVAAPDLYSRLQIETGDRLNIGGLEFRLTGRVIREPDRIATPFTLGPRVFVSADGFDQTGLQQKGSRIVHRVLIKLPDPYAPEDLESLTEELRQRVGEAGPYRVRSYIESQEELRRALQRAANFLGLVALLSLLLGGLGIAQTTGAWLVSRMDDVAILRCLGLAPGGVLVLYLGQATILASVGSALGVGLGVLIQAVLPALFKGVLAGSQLKLWQPMVFARGMSLGLGVALLFSFRALLLIRKVPPLRVLRKDVEPLPGRRWVNLLFLAILVAGTWLVAAVQAGSVVRGLQFTLGLTIASFLLAAIAILIMRSMAPLARRLRWLWLRQGLLSLTRPGAATLGAIVSLGIGILMILGLQLVKNRLSDQLRHELPEDAPTAFLVNIQPDQWSGVSALLDSNGAERIHSVPVITARLKSIDGQPTRDLAAGEEEGDRRWALTREQRLTYMDELPADNRVISGALWSHPSDPEVSIEEDFARELGVDVGSRLQFDLQGVPVDLLVSSIRSVEWTSFGINFYLVVEPGVLEEAPQQRLATAQLPPAREQEIQDLLATGYPNVTLLKLGEILEQLARVFGALARGIGFIGAFTAVAGIIILAGGISADAVRRRQHIALLKTLGMTQRGIAAMLAVEFTVIGAVAGLIGVGGGTLLSWAVVTRGLQLDWTPQPVTLALAFGITLLLSIATGIASSRKALYQSPAAVLRGD